MNQEWSEIVADFTTPPAQRLSDLCLEFRRRREQEGHTEAVTIMRFKIREIGWSANQSGGAKYMTELCDMAEDIGGTEAAVTIDHAWDGIGGWVA